MSEHTTTPAKRIRRSLPETRKLLLQAGRDLALKQGVTPLVGIKLADAADSVGLTTGSAYKIWESQSEFQHELALYLASSFEWAQISSTIPELETEPQKWNEWSVANAYFKKFSTDPGFFVALQLWGIHHPDDELTDAIQKGYKKVTTDTENFLQLYLDTSQRRLRKPYQITDIAVALSLITEGAALRHRFDPSALNSSDPTSPGRFIDIVKAVLTFYTTTNEPNEN